MAKASVLIALALAAAGLPVLAHADPCEGRLPLRAGTVFEGSVRYVVDGDEFCIGASDDAKSWVAVRMADFIAPNLNTPEGQNAKNILEAKIIGRQVSCTATAGPAGGIIAYDQLWRGRAMAVCSLEGQPVASILQGAERP